MLTAQGIGDLIRTYADGPTRLEAAVAGIPTDVLDFKPGPEHWSIRSP